MFGIFYYLDLLVRFGGIGTKKVHIYWIFLSPLFLQFIIQTTFLSTFTLDRSRLFCGPYTSTNQTTVPKTLWLLVPGGEDPPESHENTPQNSKLCSP